MSVSSLDTRIFDERLRIKPAPWLTLETWEDLQLSLRYSQALAHEEYAMEEQPQQWFSAVLKTLETLKFGLFDHTHNAIEYEPHLHALSDVYNGYLPPKRNKGPWYRSLEKNINAALYSAGRRAFSVTNASSHLSIEMDREEDNTPIVILFYVYCVTTPHTPHQKLNLIFDHLGARFNVKAFDPLREGLQAYNREKLIEMLKHELY